MTVSGEEGAAVTSSMNPVRFERVPLRSQRRRWKSTSSLAQMRSQPAERPRLVRTLGAFSARHFGWRGPCIGRAPESPPPSRIEPWPRAGSESESVACARLSGNVTTRELRASSVYSNRSPSFVLDHCAQLEVDRRHDRSDERAAISDHSIDKNRQLTGRSQR